MMCKHLFTGSVADLVQVEPEIDSPDAEEETSSAVLPLQG